jgi:hypothetical protein
MLQSPVQFDLQSSVFPKGKKKVKKEKGETARSFLSPAAMPLPVCTGNCGGIKSDLPQLLCAIKRCFNGCQRIQFSLICSLLLFSREKKGKKEGRKEGEEGGTSTDFPQDRLVAMPFLAGTCGCPGLPGCYIHLKAVLKVSC